MKKWLLVLVLLSVLFSLSACNEEAKDGTKGSFFGAVQNGNISHIHGLGFLGDDLMVATHWGLYKYNNGWQEATREKHDYMGFSVTKDGFYSSGHPSVASDLKNPLGLMKGTKQGEKLQKIAFYGEIDFHTVAASFGTDTIYVFNETATDHLSEGLHYSEDGGATWKKSNMDGLKQGQLLQLAVHPTMPEKVALATTAGLYLSDDYGQTFKQLVGDAITAVTFTESGIYYAIYEEQQPLLMFISNDNQSKKVLLPTELKTNAITNIAVHPENEDQIAMVTDDLTMFETTDKAESWHVIAEKGVVGEQSNSTMKSMENFEHTHMHQSSSSEMPSNLKVKENPTFVIGEEVVLKANHMSGMEGMTATVSGAYDTTAYAVSYISTNDQTKVKNHKWVIQEEIQNAKQEVYKVGDQVVLEADHMEGMKGTTAKIDAVSTSTVYTVDYISESGQKIQNHKWVTEEELSKK